MFVYGKNYPQKKVLTTLLELPFCKEEQDINEWSPRKPDSQFLELKTKPQSHSNYYPSGTSRVVHRYWKLCVKSMNVKD